MAIVLSLMRIFPGMMTSLTPLFAALKMAGIVDWSWGIVCLPLAFGLGYLLGSPKTWRRT